MENTTIMEQPLDTITEVKVSEPIAERKEDVISTDISNSSTYGKFKDATSLLNAYESLEKEFTRKSQKLAELLKAQENTALASSENNSQQANVQDYENQNEQAKSEATLPIYKQSNWHTNVSKFFEEMPEAKQYASEIAKVIISDSELAKSKDCLKYAYASVRNHANPSVEPASLLDNPKFFDSLVENDKVKDRVIKNYLSSLLSSKKNLHFISGEPNAISPTQKPDKPKNLKEASNILKRLLES